MSRRTSHEIAMKKEYSRMFGGCETPECILEMSCENENLDPEEIEFINDVCTLIEERADRFDEIITQYSQGWALDRISKVELAILHVALCEIICRDDVPNASAIDEAVEMAKKYGGEKSFSFINGILGAFMRNEMQK